MVIEPCSEKPRLKHFAVTDAVIGAFYEVYNELGHGFLESVYREAMIVALRSKNVQVEREKTVNVEFRGETVGVFRTDLVVDNCVVVELKCARAIDSNHEAQLLNYLKATKFEVGLLLNFGVKPQFRRMILETARNRYFGAFRESVAQKSNHTSRADRVDSSRSERTQRIIRELRVIRG